MVSVMFFYAVVNDGDFFPPERNLWTRLWKPVWYSGVFNSKHIVQIRGEFDKSEIENIQNIANRKLSYDERNVWFCVTMTSLENCNIFRAKTIEFSKINGNDEISIAIDGWMKTQNPFYFPKGEKTK